MRKTISILLVFAAVAFASEPIPVNTKTGHVEKSSSGVGAVGKPYNFVDVATAGIAGGGSGTPGGGDEEFQFNNAGVFGGTSILKLTGGVIGAKADSFLFQDQASPTKKFKFDASGITSGATRIGTVPNANFTFLQPSNAVANLFVTGAGSSGNLLTAQPTVGNLADLAAASRLVGSGSASAAVVQLTLGDGLTMSGTTIRGLTDGDKGDIDVSVAGTVLTIENASVTYGKMQDVSAASKLLGRGSASGAGNVQEITLGTGLSMSGQTVNGLDVSQDLLFSAGQSITSNTGFSTSVSDPLSLYHNTSVTPAAGFGTGLFFGAETTTTPDMEQGELRTVWSDATHATRTAFMDFQLVNNAAAPASKMRLFPSGGLSVNSTTDPGAGQINANTGLKIGGSALNFSHLAGNWTLAQGPSTTASKLIGRTDASAGIPQEITLGTNLTMSGTTLNAAGGGGGGNLSNTGSPVTDQLAQFTDATHVQGITPTAPLLAGSGSLTLDTSVDFLFTSAQDITVNDSNPSGITDGLTLTHNTTGTPATGLGSGIFFQGETSTTTNTIQGELATQWSDVTHATRTSYMDFKAVNSGTNASKMRLFGSGGLSVNSTTDPGAGQINANTGFKIANTALNFSHLAGAASAAQAGVITGGTTDQLLAKNSNTNYDLKWVSPAAVSDTAFASSWNAVTTDAPSKNAVYDWGHSFDTNDDGLVDALGGPVSLLTVTATTNAPVNLLTAATNSTGTAATGFGGKFKMQLEDSTTNAQDAGQWGFEWLDATHATHRSKFAVGVMQSGGTTLTEVFNVYDDGGVCVNCDTAPASPGAGVVRLTSIEMGNATDTTVTKSAAGVLAVEGVVIPSISSTNTLTNKRITKRVTQVSNTTTWSINTDSFDYGEDTGLTGDVTIDTTGTPTVGQTLWVSITGTAARGITWDSGDFEASTVALPTTTVTTARLDVGFIWNSATSKWRCVASQ